MTPILPASAPGVGVTVADELGEDACRACRAGRTPGDLVLDLGAMPAADDFPLPTAPLPDAVHPLSMWLCRSCGLAQLSVDDTTTSEPLAIEPQALRDQATDAVGRVHRWPGLPGLGEPGTVTEFGSPHGGSWLELFETRGWGVVDPGVAQGRADVVVDTFGLMHEPDLGRGLDERVSRLAPDGVLLLLFHSLEAIVARRQWSSLRHGHYGYFSLTALRAALAAAGMPAAYAWEFELYGGTVLLAATRRPADGSGDPDPTVTGILDRERSLGLTDPARVRVLQEAADAETTALRTALAEVDPARPWYAYGAASRAVAVLHRAGATSERLRAVADASPAKQGHTMPGSRVPIISPAELVAANPKQVWLLLPDLLAEVTATYPSLGERWRTPLDGPT